MHPQFTAQIARQRTSQLRQAAASDARGAAAARPPRRAIGNGAGRTVSRLGLRLAPR